MSVTGSEKMTGSLGTDECLGGSPVLEGAINSVGTNSFFVWAPVQKAGLCSSSLAGTEKEEQEEEQEEEKEEEQEEEEKEEKREEEEDKDEEEDCRSQSG